jgi:nitroimidazol reductase NimA-like FMN-containing flavoprotein (pyridoxamine 5'-phosphate oxidase superfamily)
MPNIRTTRPEMPGYGLPSDERGLRPWSWAEQILHEGHNYWVATVRPDGRPHAMPVWAVWHGGALWFSTGGRSRKAKNLAERPDCSVSTERGTSAVVLEGRATRLPASEAPAALPALYLAKYREGYPPDSPIFCVRPRVVFGFSEAASEFGETATRWLFE